jgi:hypothetical protein
MDYTHIPHIVIVYAKRTHSKLKVQLKEYIHLFYLQHIRMEYLNSAFLMINGIKIMSI